MLPMSRRVFTGLCACLSLATPALAQAPVDISHEVLTILDVPTASGAYGHSILMDRNAGGFTVGGFAFLSTPDLREGSFSVTLTPTGTQAKLFYCGPEVLWTMVKAVNRHGAMVGWCYTRTSAGVETVDGFYRSESAKVTRLRYPGARYTEATDVNDSHVVTCWYEDQAGNIHGCRWTRSTGRYDTIDAPFSSISVTIPTAINNTGHILATVFTSATSTVGGLLRNGQWTVITLPGAAGFQVEDLTDQGAILGFVEMPNQYIGSFLLEHGVAVAVKAALPQVSISNVYALSPQRQAVGAIRTTILPSDPETGAIIVADQGFIAPLPAVLGEPLTPPAPQMAARRTAFTATHAATPTPALHLGGCPDEPPPAGTRRAGKLAMSWVGCARLR